MPKTWELTSTYGTDDRARQFAYEAISRCRHTHPAEHALDESGACVDCITEAINAALTTTERQRDELLAALHETAQMLSRDEPRLLVYGKLALRILRAAIARARSPSPVRLGQGGSGQAGEAGKE